LTTEQPSTTARTPPASPMSSPNSQRRRAGQRYVPTLGGSLAPSRSPTELDAVHTPPRDRRSVSPLRRQLPSQPSPDVAIVVIPSGGAAPAAVNTDLSQSHTPSKDVGDTSNFRSAETAAMDSSQAQAHSGLIMIMNDWQTTDI
jgi:hypothetical protein